MVSMSAQKPPDRDHDKKMMNILVNWRIMFLCQYGVAFTDSSFWREMIVAAMLKIGVEACPTKYPVIARKGIAISIVINRMGAPIMLRRDCSLNFLSA